MCTLTYYNTEDNLVITMNRDEKRARSESPPQLKNNLLMPIDDPSAGTWLAANQYGVVAALLNRYDDHNPQADSSRGAIIPQILTDNNFAQAKAALEQLNYHKYRPYSLLLLSPAEKLRYDWNGQKLESVDLTKEENYFLSSSSWRATEVLKWRAEQYQDFCQETDFSAQKMIEFHKLQYKDMELWGPFVERPDTHTKNICQLIISAKQLSFMYHDYNAVKQGKPAIENILKISSD